MTVAHQRGLYSGAPASDIMGVKIHGVEAHSGLCPENGISALEILSDAISKMKLGRIDHETTANIGKVKGGSAINIVPGLVEVKAEARSHDEGKLDAQTQHMRECFHGSGKKQGTFP